MVYFCILLSSKGTDDVFPRFLNGDQGAPLLASRPMTGVFVIAVDQVITSKFCIICCSGSDPVCQMMPDMSDGGSKATVPCWGGHVTTISKEHTLFSLGALASALRTFGARPSR